MAKHQDYKLSELKDYCACYRAVEEIESDSRNSKGGIADWFSGGPTYLTAGAQRKVDSIERKMARMNVEEE